MARYSGKPEIASELPDARVLDYGWASRSMLYCIAILIVAYLDNIGVFPGHEIQAIPGVMGGVFRC